MTPIKPKAELETDASKPQNNKSKRKSKNIQGGSLNAQSSIDAQPSIVNEEYLDNLINK